MTHEAIDMLVDSNFSLREGMLGCDVVKVADTEEGWRIGPDRGNLVWRYDPLGPGNHRVKYLTHESHGVVRVELTGHDRRFFVIPHESVMTVEDYARIPIEDIQAAEKAVGEMIAAMDAIERLANSNVEFLDRPEGPDTITYAQIGDITHIGPDRRMRGLIIRARQDGPGLFRVEEMVPARDEIGVTFVVLHPGHKYMIHEGLHDLRCRDYNPSGEYDVMSFADFLQLKR